MPKFQITHTIRRSEYLTLTIEADNEQHARTKGMEVVNRYSTADYEPGDVVEEDDSVFVTPANDDEELDDID